MVKPDTLGPDEHIDDAVRTLLNHVDKEADRQGLEDTPRRVREFYKTFLKPKPIKWTVFDAEGASEMVVQRNIPFYSLCEHHLLPFFGVACVAYVPDKSLVGLSKLARCVIVHAAALQMQERITNQVANTIMEKLAPKGVGVIVEARHMCMEMRGVQAVGAVTTSHALRGCFEKDATTKAEFFAMSKAQSTVR